MDYILRMTVKSISGIDVREALKNTARKGSAKLRQRIVKLAMAKLGDDDAAQLLQALLERAECATEKIFGTLNR